MWENGEIDVMGLDSSTLDTYRDDPRTRRYNGITIQHIDINSLHTKNPILRTMNFRKAMYWAMDRETIAELMGATPAPYYINTQAGAYPEKGITYRMTEEAKALIPPNNGYDPEKAREYFRLLWRKSARTASPLVYVQRLNVGELIGEYLSSTFRRCSAKTSSLNCAPCPPRHTTQNDFRTAVRLL